MTKQVPKNQLQMGQWYRIKLSDCCIEGMLIGQFICYLNEYEYDAEDGWEYEIILADKPEVEYWEAIFTFGRLGPSWGSWYAMPIETKEGEDEHNS